MDASHVLHADASDRAGGTAEAASQRHALPTDGAGEGLVGGDHRDDVVAGFEEKDLGGEGVAEGSRDVRSNVAD